MIFSVVCVKNSVHGGSASVHAGITPPGTRHPPHPGADTPLPPGADIPSGTRHPHPPREQTPPKTRHPPERTPPALHAGRYGQQAGGMHPAGMQSCLIKSSSNSTFENISRVKVKSILIRAPFCYRYFTMGTTETHQLHSLLEKWILQGKNFSM